MEGGCGDGFIVCLQIERVGVEEGGGEMCGAVGVAAALPLPSMRLCAIIK